jgi:hypothetical protein
MSRQKARHEVPAYLAAKLTPIGRESFGSLCESICAGSNPEVGKPPLCNELAYWLDLLATSEVTLRGGRKIHIRPFDSYRSALDGIKLSELRKTEYEAESLIRKINRIKRTPLVREMDQRDAIPAEDLLRRADFPCGSQFETLLRLREIAKMLLGNPRKPRKPDFDSDLSRIYRYIHEHTARWHDERVADILNDLLPNRATPFTGSSLKQWRQKRDLAR